MCLERYAFLYCGVREEAGTEERNLFLEQSQSIFIFSAYTDACNSSCKIVVASKRPLIETEYLMSIFLIFECLQGGDVWIRCSVDMITDLLECFTLGKHRHSVVC